MWYLDYSADNLTGPVVKNAGFDGVIRYIDYPGKPAWKHTITKAEYDSHIKAGIKVHLVFESGKTDPDGGFARGVQYGRLAKEGAAKLGYTGVIFFCNDNPTLSPGWKKYLEGAASVLGWNRIGAYGFANAMDVAKTTSAVAFWQAGRRSDVRPFVNFWQDNNNLDKIHVGGITCDRNLVLKPMPNVDGGEEDLKEDERRWLRELHELYRKGNATPGFNQTAGELTLIIIEMLNRSRRMEATIDGLVEAIASGSNLTAEEVTEAVREALKDTVVNVDINVNKVVEG